MTFIPSLIILSALAACVFSNEEVPEMVLPPDLAQSFQAVQFSSFSYTSACLPSKEQDIKILLHTRNNPDDPITLNPSNPSTIDPSKKVIMVIHGWVSGPTAYGIPALKNAYLKRYDCNLIILDWSKIAWKLYSTSQCEIPGIAKFGADFLCVLNKQFKIALSTVHIVGHSLGAHLAGYIGKNAQNQCEKIGRITGLDPAGPLYQGAPASARLDASDATFVDVIHTNALQFGYFGNIGTVDFHVNCGVFQPSCPNINLGNPEESAVSLVCCSHLRSIDYMVESIISKEFKAKSCTACPYICMADILKADHVTMGEDCSVNLPSSAYWIPTKDASPYAKGCRPYPLGC